MHPQASAGAQRENTSLNARAWSSQGGRTPLNMPLPKQRTSRGNGYTTWKKRHTPQRGGGWAQKEEARGDGDQRGRKMSTSAMGEGGSGARRSDINAPSCSEIEKEKRNGKMRVGRNAQGVRYGEMLACGAGEAIEPVSRRDTDSARTPHPSRGFAAPRHHPEGGGSCGWCK